MGSEAIEDVTRAGADTVEHGWYMTEENCRTMIEHDVYLVPTVEQHLGDRPQRPGAEHAVGGDDRGRRAADPRTATAWRSSMGVKIAAGTDVGGNISHLYGDSAKELEVTSTAACRRSTRSRRRRCDGGEGDQARRIRSGRSSRASSPTWS